jgi:hypothetical protein
MGDDDLEQVSRHDWGCVLVKGPRSDLAWDRLGVRACKRCSSSRAASRAVKEVKVVNRSRSNSVKVDIRSMLSCVV